MTPPQRSSPGLSPSTSAPSTTSTPTRSSPPSPPTPTSTTTAARSAALDAIRRWVNKEMVGDNVTIEPVEVLDHYGDTIVRGRYDGTYDKTNLPAELIMSNYFSVRDGKIVSLAVIRNQPSEYDETAYDETAQ